MRCDLLVAAAIAVVFAAAVALIIEFEGEGFAAVWTLDFAFVQNGAVDADLFVAVWTFYFVDVLIVAAAVVIAAAIITAASFLAFSYAFTLAAVVSAASFISHKKTSLA